MSPFEELALSVAIVFAASLLFVNAIEYLAGRLKWSQSFTGSIISPLFTSIPELFVFLIAIFAYSSSRGHEIGLGSIFGEPFMTSTLSYFLVMISVLFALMLKRPVSKRFDVRREMQLPYAFIALLFPWLLIPGFVHSGALQVLMGVGYLFLYVVYVLLVRRHSDSEVEETDEEPYLVRLFKKPIFVYVQLGAAAALLYYGSTLLIESISQVSGSSAGLALSLSIVLVPVATAIPETIAAMIWAFRGKNSLAVGALVGENVLYATFYPGVSLLLVPWTINLSAMISIIGTSLVSALYLVYIRKGSIPLYILPVGFLFYLAFVFSIYL